MSDTPAFEVPGLGVLEPLDGGWSGRTFLATLGGERTVVRVYDPEDVTAPATDAAVLALGRTVLADVAPVPQVLEVRAGDPTSQAPGLLLTEHLAGTRGDLVLPTLAGPDLAAVGAAVGEVAAALGSAVQPRAGRFGDPSLSVQPWPEPWDAATIDELASVLLPGLGLPEESHAALLSLCRDAQQVLDAAPGASLVHSDLNPKNLLLTTDGPGRWRVSGVLDWEFAHVGSPWADLGNLVRRDREPAYAEAVLATVATRRGVPAATALDRARAADLVAVLELARRRGSNPVADAAHAQLVAMVRSGDLHAH